MRRPAARSARRCSGKQQDADPLDVDRRRPCHRRHPPSSHGRERERGEHEHDHEHVVVATSGEIDREQRVPADEGDGERCPSRQKPCECRREKHSGCGERLERPGCRGCRPVCGQCDRLGCERERRTVDGGRGMPGGAHVPVGGVAGIGARLHGIRVGTVGRCDARVVPVRPRVGRAEKRCEQGQQLDGDRDGHDRPQAGTPAPDQRQRYEIRRESSPQAREIEPRYPLPGRRARTQRRARGPHARGADCDQAGRRCAGDEQWKAPRTRVEWMPPRRRPSLRRGPQHRSSRSKPFRRTRRRARHARTNPSPHCGEARRRALNAG